MRKIIFLYHAVFCAILINCQSVDEPQKPDNLIKEDCMAELLSEIAFLKAAKGSFKKKMEIEGMDPQTYILEKYSIDSLTFTQSNDWYSHHLKTYEKIFEDVKMNIKLATIENDRLKREADSLKKAQDSINKLSEKKKDSIQNEELKLNPEEIE